MDTNNLEKGRTWVRNLEILIKNLGSLAKGDYSVFTESIKDYLQMNMKEKQSGSF